MTVTVTCTAAAAPKSYEARLPVGQFRCIKCYQLVARGGDGKHEVRPTK